MSLSREVISLLAADAAQQRDVALAVAQQVGDEPRFHQDGTLYGVLTSNPREYVPPSRYLRSRKTGEKFWRAINEAKLKAPRDSSKYIILKARANYIQDHGFLLAWRVYREFLRHLEA